LEYIMALSLLAPSIVGVGTSRRRFLFVDISDVYCYVVPIDTFWASAAVHNYVCRIAVHFSKLPSIPRTPHGRGP
jgi:hypothetical protein